MTLEEDQGGLPKEACPGFAAKEIKCRDLRKGGVKVHGACGNLRDKEKELHFLVNSLSKSNM